ncbi:hypothetical protein B0188_10120 [[Haemophilus] felis]|uniref:Uncharacterized protein n=1 Tax=[Haemophilus] felis TaxID=123822 RepID=A0A1T0AX36_9PAST|nr:hypothetical protein B0188_10120 [[Haemophilus] felis]
MNDTPKQKNPFKANLDGFLKERGNKGEKFQWAFFVYPQFNRQFELIKDANARCLREFPDHFHHKQQLAKECEDLKGRLSQGYELMKHWRAEKELTEQELKQYKTFKHAVFYLMGHFEMVVDNVAELQGGANE